MAVNQFNLKEGQRAERKLLITVAEWEDENGNISIQVPDPADPTQTITKKFSREILGTRTPDSSIEYNGDITTETDIRGNNFTDLNKTQPQQDFDPYLVLGGSKLGALLNDIRRRNALSELNMFNLYIITAFVGDAATGYDTEKHTGCTILYNSIGGDVNVNFPISAYFSNNITTGKVDKLVDTFTFTPDVTI